MPYPLGHLRYSGQLQHGLLFRGCLGRQQTQMKNTSSIPKTKCIKCGYVMDCTTGAYGDAKPSAGDFSLCLACGHVSVFNSDLTLREPAEEEQKTIDFHYPLLQAQIVRSWIVGDKIKNRKHDQQTDIPPEDKEAQNEPSR